MNAARIEVPALLSGAWRDLTARRAAMVGVMCLAVATQILFQYRIFEDYALEDVLEAFFEYLGEVLVVGYLVLGVVLLVDQRFFAEGGRRNAMLVAAVVVACALGVAIAFAFRYGDGPFPTVFYAFGEVVRWSTLAGLAVLIHEMQRRDRRSTANLHRVQLDRIAIEKRRAEARLQVMKAQIEPHFLFNTLATVKRLYRTDTVRGAKMLESLVQYLHGALPRLREDEATLGDELELISAYLEILRIRMGDRLRFRVDVSPLALGVPFPSMMLITLVENAIKHGLGPRTEGGRIEIRGGIVEGRLEVEVADDGVGFQAHSGSGIGLANIRARLEALHGSGARLTLEPNVPTGVVARIHAPVAGSPRRP